MANKVHLIENNDVKFIPSVVLLAVKPQNMQTALSDIQGFVGENTLIVSIAAGTTIAEIESVLVDRPVIRVMPNTPAQVKRGISAIYCNQNATEQQKKLAGELMASVGEVVWLDSEEQIDLVTGLSGTGPAYVFFAYRVSHACWYTFRTFIGNCTQISDTNCSRIR